MDKIKRLILCSLPTSICNFRCNYCYLSHRDEYWQGKQAQFAYSPEHIGKAFSIERLGGVSFFNICADGETLLTKDFDKYVFEVLKQGHYVEIVTNLTATSMLDKILKWESDILKRITFKASFHYLQLKERNLLNVFAENVNKIWNSGASVSIEMMPDDSMIPYIDEIKVFSLEHFGALPHLSIVRDDRHEHDYLTQLSAAEYEKIWSQFDSEFWKFKHSIFNVKRNEYCYAGAWSLYVNLATGDAVQCYCSRYSQNIYQDLSAPIEFVAIGKCSETHCYNGHALLTLGCIPGLTTTKYGNIRDRVKNDGSHWIQEEMRLFLNSQLEESNESFNRNEILRNEMKIYEKKVERGIKRFLN